MRQIACKVLRQIKCKVTSLVLPSPVGLIKYIINPKTCYNEDVQGPTATAILDLARRHGVAYRPTIADAWAHHVTRLADDEVVLDEIELLLLGLERAGYLSGPDAARLQVNYLREAKL